MQMARLTLEGIKIMHRIFLADYDWKIEDGSLILDSMLNVEAFKWRDGDHFKLIFDGKTFKFEKVDPLTLFTLGVNKDGTGRCRS